MKTIITSENAPLPIGPYSHANMVPASGNMLFVSGQVAKDAKTGELILGDIKSETKKVMENVSAILKDVRDTSKIRSNKIRFNVFNLLKLSINNNYFIQK